MELKRTNTFGKPEHLKSRKRIEALFAGGKSFFVHPIKVIWRKAEKEPPAPVSLPADTGDLILPIIPGATGVKVGVSASKRNFKKAVDRNKVKRLLRETYRLNKQGLLLATSKQGIGLEVFFIYVDKTIPTFIGLDDKMKTCIKKLQKIMEGGL